MPCGEIINYGHGTGCIFSVCILKTTDPKACTQNTILFIVEMPLHFGLVRKADSPSHYNQQQTLRAGATLLPVLPWKHRLLRCTSRDPNESPCTVATRGPSAGESFHPQEWERCFLFQGCAGEALQSSTLPFAISILSHCAGGASGGCSAGTVLLGVGCCGTHSGCPAL